MDMTGKYSAQQLNFVILSGFDSRRRENEENFSTEMFFEFKKCYFTIETRY